MPESPAIKKFRETLDYISKMVSSDLARDVLYQITQDADSQQALENAILAVSGDVSTSGAGIYLSNGENRRRALRALLLLQRVYLSTPYLPESFREDVPGGWPAGTISYWKSRSEPEIIEAMKMYMKLGDASSARLIAAARIEPTEGNTIKSKLHRLTRNDPNFPIDTTCYRAVQSWLLVAGYVSLPWFLKNFPKAAQVGSGVQVNMGAKLIAIFGQGTPRDCSTDEGIPDIPLGKFVYIYKANNDGTPNIFGALGHWMISAGNGMGYGCNNGQGAADHPNNKYAYCSLVNQIKDQRPEQRPNSVSLKTYIRIYDPRLI